VNHDAIRESARRLAEQHNTTHPISEDKQRRIRVLLTDRRTT